MPKASHPTTRSSRPNGLRKALLPSKEKSPPRGKAGFLRQGGVKVNELSSFRSGPRNSLLHERVNYSKRPFKKRTFRAVEPTRLTPFTAPLTPATAFGEGTVTGVFVGGIVWGDSVERGLGDVVTDCPAQEESANNTITERAFIEFNLSRRGNFIALTLTFRGALAITFQPRFAMALPGNLRCYREICPIL